MPGDVFPVRAGDEPVPADVMIGLAGWSPRERGCASTGWTFSREKLVFPA